MANSIAYITKHVNLLDEVFKKESVTAILDRPEIDSLFVGAKSIKVPRLFLDGLGDYTRLDGAGYSSGSVNIDYETLTLSKDRSKKFQIDVMDEDESGVLATTVLNEFLRTKVIPEIDAYRFSQMVSKAYSSLTSQTISANTIISAFNTALQTLADLDVPTNRMVFFVSNAVMTLIRNTTELSKTITQMEYVNPFGVTFDLMAYNGIPIIPVPKERFYSSYTFGTTGFGPASGAYLINFILADITSVWAVKKHASLKFVSPVDNQDGDGAILAYRIYHDCFVPQNKTVAVYANVSAAAATLPGSITFETAAGTATNDTVISNVKVFGGLRGDLMYSLSATAVGSVTLPVYGADLSAYTALTQDIDIACATNVTIIVALVDASDKCITAAKATLVKKSG